MTSRPSPKGPDDALGAQWAAYEQDAGPLVFLVGCQRSGTTWLHMQLARSGAFRFLSAYDVHAQAQGALVHNHLSDGAAGARADFEARLAGVAADRGIDAIPARADTPEEYGLVIGDGQLRYEHPDTTPDSLHLLRELCAKKALIDERDRPLLLKSPPDYPAALPLLASTWPDAHFIAIQRHPLATLQSQVNAWRQLVLKPNPYLLLLERGYRDLVDDPSRRMRQGLFLHSPAGVAWLADSILRAHLGFVAWLETRPEARLLTLRYEDMCADQQGVFGRIGRFLDMDLAPPKAAPAPRESRVSPEVLQAYEARRDAFAPFLERFGYGAPAMA
ncbi:MAG: sulfotransferase [Caulobacter sp.]